MPQLSQAGEIYASQLFWLAIIFGLIYFGIGRAMVPRIEATIDGRSAQIGADLAAAERAQASASAAGLAYQGRIDAARAKAAAALDVAKDRAAIETRTTVAAGDADAAIGVGAAMTRIEGSRRAALGEIENATVEAVEAIVARVSGVAVDPVEIADLVRAGLAHG